MKLSTVSSAKLRHHARRVRHHSVRAAKAVHRHALSTRKRIILSVFAVLVVPIVLVQLFYPTDVLLPNMTVGSVPLGGISKHEATARLDAAYDSAKVPVYFTDSNEVVVEPKLGDLGITTDNQVRVDAYDYPFVWRLVPSSLFWYQALVRDGEPEATNDEAALATYVVNRFGETCEFEPINGTIISHNGRLELVEASRGGSCDGNELTEKLKRVTAQLNPEKITVSGTSTAPEISTKDAKAEYDRLVAQLGEGILLKYEDTTERIDAATVTPWIEYSVQEGKLALGINSLEATKWLEDTYNEKVTFEPGITVVTTHDFKEVSRETGKKGQSLNTAATIEEIIKDLKGEADTATLVINTVEPTMTYKRSYSSTDNGLSAVMKNYADTHPGTYGVKLIELSGERRNAEYHSTQQYTTASTYKLFVAYSTLLRIERGEWQWTDQISGGRDASQCFDEMIKFSNNECAVALLHKIGFKPITNDAHAIGAKNTSFLGGNGIKSTAADEALLLSLVYSGQILSQESRDKWVAAMKANAFRQGIPKGVPNATVANKVGFLDAWLHDASIVYSPKGDYVLVVLTENASWGNIAELARELESVR